MGASYIERNWPPALKESGAWPLSSLRQSFLNGSLTRLVDPDRVLRQKIAEFVESGDFGLASGDEAQGQFTRTWYREAVPADEVSFDSATFLITKTKAELLLASPKEPEPTPEPGPSPRPEPAPLPEPTPTPPPVPEKATLRLRGTVPLESWNMVGIKLLPKLRSGEGLNLAVDLSVQVDSSALQSLEADPTTGPGGPGSWTTR